MEIDSLDIQIYEEDIASNTYMIGRYQRKISESLMSKWDGADTEYVDKLVAKLNQQVERLQKENRKLGAIVKSWYKQNNN
jgi:hypothetical protein